MSAALSGREASARRSAAFWRHLVTRALELTDTPFYLLSADPVQEALDSLRILEGHGRVGIRHWLSCKTQPVRPLLRWWRARGGGIEVVSEFELLAALREGFGAEAILVNGPAKHRWLPRHRVPGLRVNFDSSFEAERLLPIAREMDWSVGVRCRTHEEIRGGLPGFPAQFGLPAAEAVGLMQRLLRAGVRFETAHFHLRTNVESADAYDRAIGEVAGICRAARFNPKHLDCGGGFPAPGVVSRGGKPLDRTFEQESMARVCARVPERFPGLRELWFENGRFMSARAGVLVVSVLDVKRNGRMRHLICDGGRTTQAMISQWEVHPIMAVPDRGGMRRLAIVCGQTCMAFDQLARPCLPVNVKPGDRLVWMDAGAYHIPWETRFSHGLAAVVWHEGSALKLARAAESFESWWGQWLPDDSVKLAIPSHGRRAVVSRKGQ